jgi:hypothetical protein
MPGTCRGYGSTRNRRFDRWQRHDESQPHPLSAHALEFTRSTGTALPTRMNGERPPSGDEKLSVAKRLWPGEILECRRKRSASSAQTLSSRNRSCTPIILAATSKLAA